MRYSSLCLAAVAVSACAPPDDFDVYVTDTAGVAVRDVLVSVTIDQPHDSFALWCGLTDENGRSRFDLSYSCVPMMAECYNDPTQVTAQKDGYVSASTDVTVPSPPRVDLQLAPCDTACATDALNSGCQHYGSGDVVYLASTTGDGADCGVSTKCRADDPCIDTTRGECLSHG